MTRTTDGSLRSDGLISGRRTGFLAMNSERMLYIGRLGASSMRMLGSVTIYVSVDKPFLLRCDGKKWQELDCAILPPEVPHQITASNALVSVLIEPECIDLERLPYQNGGTECNHSNLDRLRECMRALGEQASISCSYGDLLCDGIDTAIFDAVPMRKQMDQRIRKVLDWINEQPDESLSAEQCAEIAGLSFSRFLHLFKEEVGLTFRRFKAWKRARRLLYFVTKSPNLTDIALEIGYPDSSYFSHSIRNVYGFRPKDMFAGSRRLNLFTHCKSTSFAK